MGYVYIDVNYGKYVDDFVCPYVNMGYVYIGIRLSKTESMNAISNSSKVKLLIFLTSTLVKMICKISVKSFC